MPGLEQLTFTMLTPNSSNFLNSSNFGVPENASATLLYIFFGVISFLTIVGNAVVCIVFRLQYEIFGSITNTLILNQSVIDLCTGIIFAILKFAPRISWNSLLWFSVACHIHISEYHFWSLSYTSTFNLVLLSVERYFAICQPVRHQKLFTKECVKGYCFIVWCIGFAFQIYLPIVHHVESNGQCKFEWPNKVAQMAMGTFVFVAEYFIPLIIMTLSYSLIWWQLKKRTRSKTKIKAFSAGKRNVTVTLCLVFISYVICWSPDALAYFYFNLGGSYDFNSTTHHFVMILVLCNMLTNPCIYAFKYDRFRQQLKALIACCQTETQGNISRSKTSTDGTSLHTISRNMKKDDAVQDNEGHCSL